MRKQGRNLKYDKDMINKAMEEYIDTEMSADEVGMKYNIPGAVLLYHYRKLRKEQEENGTE